MKISHAKICIKYSHQDKISENKSPQLNISKSIISATHASPIPYSHCPKTNINHREISKPGKSIEFLPSNDVTLWTVYFKAKYNKLTRLILAYYKENALFFVTIRKVSNGVVEWLKLIYS